MRRRSGFTLIELMIVLAIIAALAAILAPIGLNALNRAKATQYLSDIKNIHTAAQLYLFDNGDFTKAGTNTMKPYIDLGELTVKDSYIYGTSTTTPSTMTITMKGMTDNVWEQFEVAMPEQLGKTGSKFVVNLDFNN